MKKLLLLTATLVCLVNLRAQSDHPDSSFGTNGIVKTYLGKTFNYGAHTARQVLPLPNGDFYVIYQDENGTDSYISKRHSNGSFDSSFGGNGQSANSGFTISKAAIQSDSKIVVTGFILHDYYYDFAVGRYNTDGSLDSSFSDDGIQTTDFGNSQDKLSYSVFIQKDKKILVQGHIYDNAAYVSFARYNPNGSPDSTFNNNGFFKTDIINALAQSTLQSDGKIVVAYSGGLIRLNNNASRDSTFVSDPALSLRTVYSLVTGVNGKIAVLANDGNTIYRFNSNGSTDTDFGNNGSVQKNDTAYPFQAIVIQNDGKIVALNYLDLVRYNTDGGLDDTFQNGKHTFFGPYSFAATLALQPDGKILVGGEKTEVDSGYTHNLVLARYTTVGKPDSTFDADGYLLYGYHLGKTVYTNIVTQKDGKIVTAGRTWNGQTSDYTIVLYNSNGSIDKTFGKDGIVTTSILKGVSGNEGFTISIAVQSDGKIVAAGGYSPERYNTDGSLDKTFLIDTAANKEARYIINSIAIQKDGKILVNQVDQGTDFINFWVVRYNTNGTLDNTFGIDGKHKTARFPSSLALQADGKIIVGCDDGIERLNTNGSPDNTFDYDGKAYFFNYGHTSSVAIQSDGKIVAAGFEGGNIIMRRFNTNGSLDQTFNNTSYSTTYTTSVVISMALQSNGKIVVLSSELLRFYNNGTRDYSFNLTNEEKIDYERQDITVADGKLYVAGGNYYGVVEKYLLDNSSSVPPVVSLTTPADNAYFIEGTDIKFTAAASDIDGTITKVEFYNGDILLHIEYAAPYGYQLKNVAAGNYTITARATDNEGQVSISAPVHITVVSKNSFNISIVSPVNNEVYAAPAYVHLKAEVKNPHGKIARVEFYNGAILLRNEYKYPYTYVWRNVPEGVYYVTAKAIDEQGFVTTSETIIIKVIERQTIVSSRPYKENEKTALNDAFHLRLSPNPTSNIINIQANGLQQSKPATLSIISNAGNVLKNIQISNSSTQLDVSTLASGVYTIKIVSGDKVLYKQFIKL